MDHAFMRFLPLILAFSAACASKQSPAPSCHTPVMVIEPAVLSEPPPDPPATPPPPAKPAPAVVLVQGAASPDPALPYPITKIVAPTKDEVISAANAANFEVKLDVKNWPTAPGSSHVHLILDNHPYKPLYDWTALTKLSELTDGQPLSEGEHILVAFPGRANHESVKTKNALAIVEFSVGKKGSDRDDVRKPRLIYSRPKGIYKGEMANHVLIDFQLLNAALAPKKDHVKIEVAGPGISQPLTATAEQFGAPYYLDNLQSGDYTVTLTLLGPDGQQVPGDWNKTRRVIQIVRD